MKRMFLALTAAVLITSGAVAAPMKGTGWLGQRRQVRRQQD